MHCTYFSKIGSCAVLLPVHTKNGGCPKMGVNTELALWLATFAKTMKHKFSVDIFGKIVFALQNRSLPEYLSRSTQANSVFLFNKKGGQNLSLTTTANLTHFPVASARLFALP